MKYLKKISLVVFVVLLSCTENEQIKENQLDENLLQKEIPEHKTPEMSPFLFPNNHEIFELETLDDLLAFYPEIDKKYGNEDYIGNLKSIAIHATFYNGLLEEDTETILFYVNELANASLNLLNIENFNNAILELESRKVDADLLELMVLKFSQKHKNFLKKMKDEDKKEKHENRLALLDKLESRYN